MKSPSGFLWKNHWKKETLLTYYYSAIFRMQLLLLPPGETAEGLGQRKRRIRRNGIPGRIPAGGAYRPDRGKGL